MCDEVIGVTQVEALSKDLSENKIELDELSRQVFELNVKVQSNIDLSDDLIATASNSINVVEDRVAITLQHTEQVLASAHELIDFYLIVFTLIAGFLGLAITYFLGKKQNDHLDRAAARIAININEDENFKNELVMKLLKNEAFRNDIFVTMKKYISDSDSDSDDSEQISKMKEEFSEEKK